MSKEWQRCPVCGGRGIVPPGFYVTVAGGRYESTSLSPDQCRQCKGTGLLRRPKGED